ncbi:hypothetical protein ACPV54_25960 [Vibrio mediterranei]
MVKKASQLSSSSRNAAIEELAEELSEKPYGSSKERPAKMARTTISLEADILFKLEDFAKKNKREKKEFKSVSSIVRSAVDDFILKYEV